MWEKSHEYLFICCESCCHVNVSCGDLYHVSKSCKDLCEADKPRNKPFLREVLAHLKTSWQTIVARDTSMSTNLTTSNILMTNNSNLMLSTNNLAPNHQNLSKWAKISWWLQQSRDSSLATTSATLVNLVTTYAMPTNFATNHFYERFCHVNKPRDKSFWQEILLYQQTSWRVIVSRQTMNTSNLMINHQN